MVLHTCMINCHREFRVVTGLILGLRPANERRRYKSNAVSHWIGATLESALSKKEKQCPCTLIHRTYYLVFFVDYVFYCARWVNGGSSVNLTSVFGCLYIKTSKILLKLTSTVDSVFVVVVATINLSLPEAVSQPPIAAIYNTAGFPMNNTSVTRE